MRKQFFVNVIAVTMSLSQFSPMALAGTSTSQLVCPNLNASGVQLLSSISELKSKLKQGPECTPIADKLTLVGDIINNPNWKTARAVLMGEQSQALEGEQIAALGNLVARATSNLSEVVQLLGTRGTQCLERGKQGSFLVGLSGLVREVSTVVGTATGPYGMAVSLGGNLLSSVITGIDGFLKGFFKGYNFSNSDDETLFMNQFCSFAEIQKDTMDFLNIHDRPAELAMLHEYLLAKTNDLEANCIECKAFKIAYQAREESRKIINRIQEDAKIIAPGQDRDHVVYARCTEIHRAIHSDNSDMQQFFSLIRNYENPLMSASDAVLLQDVQKASEQLKELFPRLDQCWRLNYDQRLEISKSFNNFLRDDVLPLASSIFEQQMRTFQAAANKKYVSPLGDYMEKSLERLRWIQEEEKKIENEIKDPNHHESARLVRESNNKLRERFTDELLPKYLRYKYRENRKQIKSFNKEYGDFKDSMIKHFGKNHALQGKSFSEVKEIIKTKGGNDYRIFVTEENKVVDLLKLAVEQSHSINRYCEYARYMTLSDIRLNDRCTEITLKLKAQFNRTTAKYTELSLPMPMNTIFAESNRIFSSSRIADFAAHLGEWNARGDERWTLRD